MAQLLIEHGAEIDAKTDLSNTAMHFAASEKFLEMTQLLIGHGANTDGIDLSWMDDHEDS